MKTAVENIAQLVSCSGGPEALPKVTVHHNVTLVIEDGLVKEITPDKVTNTDQTVDAQGGVIVPGFVDAHTHLVFAGNRAKELEWRAKGLSYLEIAARGGGILETVRQTRSATEEQLFELGLKHLTWCLRNGTTTFESKSGYGLDLQTELHILLALHRIDATLCQMTDEPPGSRLSPTCLGLHALPPEASDRSSYVDHMVDEVLPVIAKAGLAKSVDAFIEYGHFEHDDARKLAVKAKEFGMQLRLHVDQITDNGGAALAAEIGAFTADHLEQTTPEGIACLAMSQTIPILLPGSVFGLGLSKYADARAMIDAGLPIVLATDFNPGSSPTPSIPFIMCLAVRHMKLTPEEALAAVTINAARSLGMDDRGRLGTGQKADFSVWQLDDWREVATWIDGPRPSQVWANGIRLV